jgi:hypothetical protein
VTTPTHYTHYAILTDVTPHRATVVRVVEGECEPDRRLAAPITCEELPVEGERVWIRREGFDVVAVVARQ